MVTTDELLHKTIVQTVCSTCILYYKLFVLQIPTEPRHSLQPAGAARVTLCPVAIVMVVNMPLAPRTRDKEAPHETDHHRGDRRYRSAAARAGHRRRTRRDRRGAEPAEPLAGTGARRGRRPRLR